MKTKPHRFIRGRWQTQPLCVPVRTPLESTTYLIGNVPQTLQYTVQLIHHLVRLHQERPQRTSLGRQRDLRTYVHTYKHTARQPGTHLTRRTTCTHQYIRHINTYYHSLQAGELTRHACTPFKVKGYPTARVHILTLLQPPPILQHVPLLLCNPTG